MLLEKGDTLKISDLQEALKEHWRMRHHLVNEGKDIGKDEVGQFLEALKALMGTLQKSKNVES